MNKTIKLNSLNIKIIRLFSSTVVVFRNNNRINNNINSSFVDNKIDQYRHINTEDEHHQQDEDYKKVQIHLQSSNLLTSVNQQNCISNMNKAPPINLSKKSNGKFASVLIPICEQNNELSILYTRRSGKISSHFRQISFPGGMKDDTDRTYEECALRETHEEIGIPSNRINIWGTGKLIMPRDGPQIMPVIGTIFNFNSNELRLNADEVDQVFTVPLKLLCSDKCKNYTQFRTGTGYSIPVYTVDRTTHIWGITAVITYLFLTSLLPKTIYKHNLKYLSKIQ